MLRKLCLAALTAAIAAAWACGTPSKTEEPTHGNDVPDGAYQTPPPDAASLPADASQSGGDDASTDGGTSDAAIAPDASLPEAMESEPNDVTKKLTDVNPMALPSKMSGVIDPADDIDSFELNLTAGTVVTWELAAVGASMTPHFALIESTQNVPNLVSIGPAGGTAVQEQFVLEGGKYYAIVRDARNVPASSSSHVGGPGFTYALTAQLTPKTPTTFTFPAIEKGTLAGPRRIDLYKFTAAAQTNFTAEIFAARKAPPSNMDSQLSLYDATRKVWLKTNDDPAGGGPDSKLTGIVNAGEYIFVVENLDPAATDLSYELHLSSP